MTAVSHRIAHVVSIAVFLCPVLAGSQPVPAVPATFSALPHAFSQGLSLTAAQGISLMGSFQLGTQEIRFQVHEAFVPDPSMFQSKKGANAASLGGCLADESGLIISGWGIDADGNEYAQYPQIMGDGLVSDDSSLEKKVQSLDTWCLHRKTSIDGFVSLMRQLEFERVASQQSALQERLPAWILLMSQAQDLDALCQFAASESGRLPKVGQFYSSP